MRWLYNIAKSFSSQPGVTSVRRGLTAACPLIIVGALSLMLINLPIPEYQEYIQQLLDGRVYKLFNLIYNCSFEMLSIYVVVIVSYKYAETKTDDTSEAVIVALLSLASMCALNGNISEGTISLNFGASELFSSFLCAIISSKLYFIFRSLNKRPTYNTINTDSGFGVAIKSIFPIAIILLMFVIINYGISTAFNVYGLQDLFAKGASSLFKNMESGYLSSVLFSLAVHLLWFLGIHGNNVLEPIAETQLNTDGSAIFSKGFYDAFVSIGGSGACLCLLIAVLIFSKTKEVKSIGRLGALPVLFNISEILTIGIPVLFNPIFLAPFIIIPFVFTSIAYCATYLHLVPVISSTVNWTTPVFFSGYYATGSYSGAILQGVLIIIGVLIYMPFVKMYDKYLKLEAKQKVIDLVEYMTECEKQQKDPAFLKRSDTLGQTAKVLVNELSTALKSGDITFLFQPQVDIWSRCIGCEALIRWYHPTAGSIYPPLIIQLAKEGGLLERLDRRLVYTSCELIRDIETECNQKVKVSINLTLASITNYDVCKLIASGVHRYGIYSGSLWIELTENEAFTSSDEVNHVLDTLQSRHHRLLIDDFGMGHTSIKYLQANKFDVVKLDGSLTRDITNNPVNQNIIQSISELGNKLGFDVIAEYVESKEQRDKLLELGCHFYQGYLYSKPLTKEDFIEFYKIHLIG